MKTIIYIDGDGATYEIGRPKVSKNPHNHARDVVVFRNVEGRPATRFYKARSVTDAVNFMERTAKTCNWKILSIKEVSE